MGFAWLMVAESFMTHSIICCLTDCEDDPTLIVTKDLRLFNFDGAISMTIECNAI